MSAFGSYPAVTALQAGDKFLFAQASSGAEKLIALSDLEANLSLPTLGGILPLAKGGLGSALSNPGSDQILFWNSTVAGFKFLTVGAGLEIVGNTLSAVGTGGGGGGGGAPTGATYITQLPNVSLTGSQALSALNTGLLRNTTGTGVLSIAVPGVDYLTGPGASTANALVRFNGTTGGVFKDSSVTLADAGTALVFTSGAGLTAGGTNQSITLSPSGTGITQLTTGFKTGAPGGAAGVYKFGKVTTGSVTLDTTSYVEVMIDGALIKLLKAS